MNHLGYLARGRWCVATLLLVGCLPQIVGAQDADSDPDVMLADQENSLSERFDRLELLAGRLAELSKATQPRRAELLQKLVASSREKDVPGRFKAIVEALQQDDLSEAATAQTSLQTDLVAMLELLLQEDRDRQIESERQRIAKYLAELNNLIRQQRGLKARTAGGDSEREVSEDQQRAAERTGDLGDRIEATEGKPNSSAEHKGPSEESGKRSTGESDQEPSQSDAQQDSSSEADKPSQGEPGSPRQGAPADQSQQQGRPSDSPGQKSPGQPTQGQPSSGPSSPSDARSQEPKQSPSERAVEKLRQAQQRMQQAEQRLKEAQRKQAVEEQEQALRELEQARAELEKILRQLREEEMERMLVLLEARLRKMLEAQNEVYAQTKRMEESVGHVPEHELEIACASLGRKEDQIIVEADRALVLLQEDGTSAAFPEALQQAREDMQTVAKRLRQVKTDEITQALEEDIIATLEETLAALQKALKELREQRASQQQGGGEPGEQPLVDQLAELRMIRALQNRVNRRTLYYDSVMDKDPEQKLELLDALQELAERQEHIFEATRDLSQGTNR